MRPSAEVMSKAAALAIDKDKPIKLDYYLASVQSCCQLVKNQEDQPILFKNTDENTSPLINIFVVNSTDGASDCICVSENSIYVINGCILNKKA